MAALCPSSHGSHKLSHTIAISSARQGAKKMFVIEDTFRS